MEILYGSITILLARWLAAVLCGLAFITSNKISTRINLYVTMGIMYYCCTVHTFNQVRFLRKKKKLIIELLCAA